MGKEMNQSSSLLRIWILYINSNRRATGYELDIWHDNKMRVIVSIQLPLLLSSFTLFTSTEVASSRNGCGFIASDCCVCRDANVLHVRI